MIHLSILRHIRRLIASAIIFGTAVLLMLWLPIKILKLAWPMFLPYTVNYSNYFESTCNNISYFLAAFG